MREAIAAGTLARATRERVLAGARVSATRSLLARRALRAAPAARGRRGGRGLRDRRRAWAASPARAALAERGVETRGARARHRRRRRQRPQRRLPARRAGRLLRRRPRALRRRARARASTRARSRRRRRSTRWPRSSAPATRCGAPACCACSASEEEAEHVRRQVDALRADGFPAELVERDELPPALRAHASTTPASPTTTARCSRRAGSGRWRAPPRRPARASTRAPRSRGPVRRRARSCTGARHASARGTWSWPPTARCPRWCPAYAERVRARRLHMVATEPLPERLVDCPVYARWGYEYFQQPPDGRLLAGGFSDLDGERLLHRPRRGRARAVWERIERYLAEELGVDGADHAPLGRDRRLQRRRAAVRRARCRAARACTSAGGYSGHGNVLGYVAGPADRRPDRCVAPS